MSDVPQLPFEHLGVLGCSPELHQLRERCPVARVRTEVGDDAWLVTRYDAVRRLLDDPRLGRAHPDPEHAARTTNSALFGGPLGDYDTEDQDHTRMRALLAPAFSPRRVRALQPRIEALVDELLDTMAASRDPVDLHEMLSFPLPVLVICELLGVPYDDRARFRTWSEDIADTLDAQRSQRGLDALFTYMRDLAADKLKHPAEDLISDLVSRHDFDVELDEAAALAAGMLFAGHETTMVRIDLGTLLLLTHPDQRDNLLNYPAMLSTAVEEVLRYMPGGGGGLPRYARATLDVNGVPVGAGDLVLLDLAAANHDPRTFPDPDAFDIARAPNAHLTFGLGSRYCLGAPLARVELHAALGGLFRRFPNLRLAEPVEEVKTRTQTLTGGLAALPVTW